MVKYGIRICFGRLAKEKELENLVKDYNANLCGYPQHKDCQGDVLYVGDMESEGSITASELRKEFPSLSIMGLKKIE